MKRKAFLKNLSLILALAAVICVAVGFTVFAEGEEPTLKIASKSISNKGEISIVYAVKAEGFADGTEIEFKVYEVDPIPRERYLLHLL